MLFAVLGVMVMGLVSGLSLANHSDSASFLVVCAPLSQDRFQREGFWELGRTYGLASPFALSSSWYWFVNSVFPTRIFCLKATHANGYCGSWPGCAVLVFLL